jgi:hypothetical protein
MYLDLNDIYNFNLDLEDYRDKTSSPSNKNNIQNELLVKENNDLRIKCERQGTQLRSKESILSNLQEKTKSQSDQIDSLQKEKQALILEVKTNESSKLDSLIKAVSIENEARKMIFSKLELVHSVECQEKQKIILERDSAVTQSASLRKTVENMKSEREFSIENEKKLVEQLSRNFCELSSKNGVISTFQLELQREIQCGRRWESEAKRSKEEIDIEKNINFSLKKANNTLEKEVQEGLERLYSAWDTQKSLISR